MRNLMQRSIRTRVRTLEKRAKILDFEIQLDYKELGSAMCAAHLSPLWLEDIVELRSVIIEREAKETLLNRLNELGTRDVIGEYTRILLNEERVSPEKARRMAVNQLFGEVCSKRKRLGAIEKKLNTLRSALQKITEPTE